MRRLVEFVRATYRRKLATALLVVLVLIAAVTVGLYVQLGALLGERVEQSMTAAANAEADELTEWSSQNRQIIRVLSEHSVFGAGNTTAVRAYLRTQRRTWDEAEIGNTYVIDRQNLTVEASARRALEGETVDGLPWEEEFAFRDFDDVRSTEPYTARNGTTVIGYITPIRSRPGHLLVVTIDAVSVFERFEHPVDDGFTRVVDSNGTVIFASDQSAALQQYRERSLRAPVVDAGLDGESGFTDTPSYETEAPGNTDYVAAYAPVPGTDWVVIEHAPASEAYAVIGQTRVWIGVVGTIALIGLLAVILVLGADVTGALSTLAGRAERLEQGEYDVAFDTDRPDEFGDLNRTLATTRDTLRARFEEVRETRDALAVSNAALEDRSTMVSVLNRILRHNVRNEVNVIAGRADHVEAHTDDELVREQIEKIQQAAWKLATLSDRTQRINHLLAEDATDRQSIAVADRLETALAEVRRTSPSATITLTATDEETVATGVTTLPTAVADVVEEIVTHNDGDVTVDVTVTRTDGEDGGDGSVLITVDDDGAGLPDLDIETVGQGEVTPLQHAEGLALWCLEWTVNRSGGDLTVDCADTTLELRLPATDSNSTGDG